MGGIIDLPPVQDATLRLAIRAADIADRCTIPFGWSAKFGHGQCSYLQVIAKGVCNVSGSPLEWSGRKWLLSPHMTDGEIVQTLFKAVLTAAEHEVREQFKYRGQAIFDPHYDIEKLVALRASPDALKEREPV